MPNKQGVYDTARALEIRIELNKKEIITAWILELATEFIYAVDFRFDEWGTSTPLTKYRSKKSEAKAIEEIRKTIEDNKNISKKQTLKALTLFDLHNKSRQLDIFAAA